jgi:hypothetical protein
VTAPPADRLASADYGGRAPLKRCAKCGHLWREPGDCPACGGDETLPGETAPDRASGRADAPAGRLSGAAPVAAPLPSLGVSSRDLASGVSSSASAALVGADPLAGFSLRNPVAFGVRFMLALGLAPADFDWPGIVAEATAWELAERRRAVLPEAA